MAVLGIPPRRFLELTAGHPQRRKLGQLVFLPIDAAIALVDGESGNEIGNAPQNGVAGVLAALGREEA